MPLTSWRAEDSHCEQGPNPAHNRSHSQTGEPRKGVISRVQIQLTTEGTHFLESQGKVSSAGSKSSSSHKPLTNWRARDRHCEQRPNPAHHRSHSLPGEPRRGCEQGPNPAHHRSHSLPGEPRMGAVSRVQIQLTT